MVLGSLLLVVSGGAPRALGMTGSIDTTGPDSENTILLNSVSTCVTTNSNDINANVQTDQDAQSGDVDISGNTLVGAGWNDWNPASWQARGYTYEQWHAAFQAYLSSMQGTYQTNWGSLGGGNVTSGNASNISNTNIGVEITNGSDNACARASEQTPGDGGNGSIDTTGPNSTNGVVLGNSTTMLASNGTAIGAGVLSNQDARSGAVRTNANTVGGAGGKSGNGTNMQQTGGSVSVDNSSPIGGTNGHNNNPVTGGSEPKASISTTGPDSENTITSNTITNTTVTNTNVISFMTATTQNATTGDSEATNNTSVHGGGSGNASNGSNTSMGASVTN